MKVLLHLFILFGLVALASPMSVTFTADVPEGHLVTVRSWEFDRAGAADLCNITAAHSSNCKLSRDFIASLLDGDGKIVATTDPFSKWWGGTSYANATLDVFVPRSNGTASSTSYLPMKRGLAHMAVGLSAGFVNTSGYDGHYWCSGFGVFSYNSDPSITRIKLCDTLHTPCLVREDFTVDMYCCTCCGDEDGSKRRRGGNKSNVNPDISRAVSGRPESGRGAGRRHLLQGRIECSYAGTPSSDPFSMFWGDQSWMTASGIAYSANNPNGGSYVELQKKEDGTSSIAV